MLVLIFRSRGHRSAERRTGDKRLFCNCFVNIGEFRACTLAGAARNANTRPTVCFHNYRTMRATQKKKWEWDQPASAKIQFTFCANENNIFIGLFWFLWCRTGEAVSSHALVREFIILFWFSSSQGIGHRVAHTMRTDCKCNKAKWKTKDGDKWSWMGWDARIAFRCNSHVQFRLLLLLLLLFTLHFNATNQLSFGPSK